MGGLTEHQPCTWHCGACDTRVTKSVFGGLQEPIMLEPPLTHLQLVSNGWHPALALGRCTAVWLFCLLALCDRWQIYNVRSVYKFQSFIYKMGIITPNSMGCCKDEMKLRMKHLTWDVAHSRCLDNCGGQFRFDK